MKKIEKHKNVKGKWSESPFNGSELPSDIKYDATNLINSSNKLANACKEYLYLLKKKLILLVMIIF